MKPLFALVFAATRLLMPFCFAACLAFGSASSIYIAQSSAGRANGSSCASAFAYAFFNSASNWGGGADQIGPGTTVHICGTVTFPAGSSGLVAQGSGTSAAPVVIYFESGAVLQSPYFGGTHGCYSQATCMGGIEIYNRSYFVVDGGSNGVIQNTANGTDLANQRTSVGVAVMGSADCIIIRNLTIQNIYANDPAGGTDWGGQYTSDIQVSGTNVAICNNHLGNSRIGILSSTSGGSPPVLPLPNCSSRTFAPGMNLFGNTLRDHCWHFQPGGSSTPIVNIFDNDVSGTENWVYTANESSYYHTDGVIAWGDTPQLVVYLFDNYFHDSHFGTAQFYCTYGLTGSGCAAYIFNNVFQYPALNPGTAVWLNGSAGYPLGPYFLYNNTFVNPGYMVLPAGDNLTMSLENNLVTEGTTGYNYFYAKVYGAASLGSVLAISDYNLFYGGRGLSFTGAGYWGWPPGSSWGSYSSWTVTGFDAHSIGANPKLSASYGLLVDSPARRAGANLTALCSTAGLAPVCRDKAGVARPSTGAWDIGAYQYASTPAPPTGLTTIVK